MLDNDMQTPTTTLNSLLRASRSIETPIRTKTSKPSEYPPLGADEKLKTAMTSAVAMATPLCFCREEWWEG